MFFLTSSELLSRRKQERSESTLWSLLCWMLVISGPDRVIGLWSCSLQASVSQSLTPVQKAFTVMSSASVAVLESEDPFIEKTLK